MPLEFFAPGIFIEEVPWRARQVRASDARCGDDVPAPDTAPAPAGVSRTERIGPTGLLVPEQPVMLVVRNRRDGPWGLPFLQ